MGLFYCLKKYLKKNVENCCVESKEYIIFTSSNNNKTQTDMTTSEKIFTQEYIKFPNGVICSIYKQMTKKGLRWYRYYRGRFQVISRTEIDQLIIELN